MHDNDNPFSGGGGWNMVPLSFLGPGPGSWLQQYQEAIRERYAGRSAEVPPRVQLAMALLDDFTKKTAVKPMPTKSYDETTAWEPIAGQRLTADEIAAQNAALALLSSYFSGKLKECCWDHPLKVEEVNLEDMDKLTHMKIECPSCSNRQPQITFCKMCNKKGYLLVCQVRG